MKKAVYVIIENSKGEILAFSKKDNHNVFGLIKVGDTDEILYIAIYLINKEETELYFPQHFLCFLPLPQRHGSFLPTFFVEFFKAFCASNFLREASIFLVVGFIIPLI